MDIGQDNKNKALPNPKNNQSDIAMEEEEAKAVKRGRPPAKHKIGSRGT